MDSVSDGHFWVETASQVIHFQQNISRANFTRYDTAENVQIVKFTLLGNRLYEQTGMETCPLIKETKLKR